MTALLLAVGCAGGGERTPEERLPKGDAGFAEHCTRSEDCESLLCVRVDDSGGICTHTCGSSEGCPAADNWACVSTDAVRPDICACRKLDDVERCADGQDNDCDGQVDDCRMCDGVAVPNDDPAHCGECDNACRPDQLCQNQSCGCPENLPDDCGTCVATSSDTKHCGTCDNACGTGQTCVDGECVCPDEARPSFCENAGCLDLTTDPANCGECGNGCPAAQSCVDGECVCPDDALATFCDDSGCVDVGTDSNHCGECGNVCTLATTCGEGECVCPNAAAPDFCDDLGCVDFQDDVRHCGDCGNACRIDEVCGEGECRCPTGAVECNGVCVDVNTSREHCGECGAPCATAQACVGGECGCAAFGYTVCGSDCANLSTDTAHCGMCDRACRSGEVCLQGNCQCESGVVCNDVCVSSTDSANCGACGRTCPTGQFCSASACFCEAFGLSVCGADCVNLSNDPMHCGSCTSVCRTGETCSGGSCACPTGQTYCEAAGRCVNLTNDAAHCGACGQACPAGTHCANSTCVCDAAGRTLCGDTCVDLLTDEAHCGICTRACTGNYSCLDADCLCPNPTVDVAVRATENAFQDGFPSAAWDGSHVGVLYVQQTASAQSVRFLLLNPDGSLVSDTPVSTLAMVQTDPGPRLVWTGSEYGAVWTDGTVKFVRLDGAGTPKGAPVTIAATSPTPSSNSLTWSPTNSSYAFAGINTVSGVTFQRLGLDGTSASPPNNFTHTWLPAANAIVGAAPDGTWGVGFVTLGNPGFAVFNADGSRTLAPVTVGANETGTFGSRIAMVHDGAAWLVTWVTPSANVIAASRGPTSGSHLNLITAPFGVAFGTPSVVTSAGTAAFAWPESTNSTLGRIRFRRFAIPSSGNNLRFIHDVIDVLPTATADFNPPGLVRTGANSMLAVWTDYRGSAAEIYSARISLGACP